MICHVSKGVLVVEPYSELESRRRSSTVGAINKKALASTVSIHVCNINRTAVLRSSIRTRR
jgi:hypothetical protein